MLIPRGRLAPLVREGIGVSRLLLLRGGGVAATFLTSLLIVRRFGVEVNGLFQIALGYVMIGAAIARLGQEQLALRDMAALRVTNNAAAARRSIDLSLAAALPAGLIVAAGLGLGAWRWGADGGGMVPAFAPTVLLLAGLWIVTEALRGWQLVSASVFWQGCFVPVAFVIAFVLLDAADRLDAGALPFLYAGCSLAALVGAFWSWRQVVGRRAGPIAPNRDMLAAVAGTARQGATFWMLAILTNLAGWLDLLILYAFADAATVGIFQPIVRTGGLIAVAINIAAAGLVARLAYFYAARDGAAFLRLARGYWLAIVLGAVVAGIVLLALSQRLASLWGPAIAPFHAELSVYILIQLFQAVFIIAPLAAPVMELERAVLTVQIANVPLKAVAVGIGYAQAGLMGVVAGIGFCTVVTVLWTVALFLRQLQTMDIRWQSIFARRV